MTFEFAPKDKAVTLRMAQPLLDALKAMAARHGVPYQRYMRQLLENALDSELRTSTPDKEGIIQTLRARQQELKDMGVESLSLFGSVARNEATPQSDVDIAVTVNRARGISLFDIGGIQDRIEHMLGVRTDLVMEPARKQSLQFEIERDRVRVF